MKVRLRDYATLLIILASAMTMTARRAAKVLSMQEFPLAAPQHPRKPKTKRMTPPTTRMTAPLA